MLLAKLTLEALVNALGIDLGTTTTLIARAYAGIAPHTIEAEILQIDGGNFLPSCAFFPADSDPIVGRQALELGPQLDLSRFVRAVKRLMGREVVLPVGRTPAEVSALYLAHVLNQIRDRYIDSKTELTVTVPASFTTNQRRDTVLAVRDACEQLRLPELARNTSQLLISEPVAALLAFLSKDLQFSMDRRQLAIDNAPLVLVYDIGGGTLDLTLVQLRWAEDRAAPTLGNVQFDVHELSRYNQFGGEDFDWRLAQWLRDRLWEKYPDLREVWLLDEERSRVRHEFIHEAERLKRELNEELEFDAESETYFTTRPIRIAGAEYQWEGELSGQEYTELMIDFLEERSGQRKNCLAPITELLQKANVTRADVDYLLIVGGMARSIPLMKALRQYWGDDKSVLTFSPADQAIAYGAAVYSYLKQHEPQFTIREPAADAYYVRVQEGFDLLLGRKHDAVGERRMYKLSSEGDEIMLRIFAGDEPAAQNTPLSTIYHTLVYQGGAVVKLPERKPPGTPVYIQMSYSPSDYSKLPRVRVWIDDNAEPVLDKSYEQLVQRRTLT